MAPHNHISSKRKATWILFFCIFVAQLTAAVFIYKLHLVTNLSLSWIGVYYVFSLVCAIPQAGFSDVYGRKRHLLISSVCILLSISYLSLMYLIKFSPDQASSLYWSFLTAFPACLVLGVAGNFIPIAYGGIANLKVHDFRAAVGVSSASIGFGWVIAVFFDLFLPNWVALTLTISLQALVVLVLKYFFHIPEDSEVASTSGDMKTVRNSYRWCISMLFVAGGTAALAAFFFSETTFYSIYSLNEDGIKSFSDRLIGASMAFGYATGVFIQWRIRCSDRTGIKAGVIISLISLVLLVLYKFIFKDSLIIFGSVTLIEGILNFLLALGFGFFVPSLFSLMSSKIDSHHAGRLFGVIDTTDTSALLASNYIEHLKANLKLKDIIIYSLLICIFVVSCVFYRIFIKRFSTYEKSS